MYDFGIARISEDRYAFVIEQPLHPNYSEKPTYFFTINGLTKLRSHLIESDSIQPEESPNPHWEVRLADFATDILGPTDAILIPKEIRGELIYTIARILLEPPDVATVT